MSTKTQPQPAQYTLAIDGMICGHCVRTVSATLGDVSGVAVRSVALGSAEIEAPGGLTVAAIAALDEVGTRPEFATRRRFPPKGPRRESRAAPLATATTLVRAAAAQAGCRPSSFAGVRPKEHQP